MGIGHIAIGLGLKRLDRRINAGLLIFAVLFAYFLLGWFALAGCESYQQVNSVRIRQRETISMQSPYE